MCFHELSSPQTNCTHGFEMCVNETMSTGGDNRVDLMKWNIATWNNEIEHIWEN